MGECRNTAIVLAAGQGKRMHSKIQKQFMELDGMPVLCYSLRCFQESPLIRDVILVTGEEYVSWCREEIVEKYGFTKVSAVVSGGKERYDSVFAGLKAASGCDYVLIHDGARPFLEQACLDRLCQCLSEHDACLLTVPCKDTIKVIEEGRIKETPNRSQLVQAQTPQAFKTSLILRAYRKARQEKVQATDDAQVVELLTGEAVYAVLGSYKNIKITTQEDLR